MIESNFYEYLQTHLPTNWDLQRIETTTARGMPDLSIGIPLVGELWVELKVNKTDKPTCSLRPEQFAWMVRRSQRGGKCVVLARGPKVWSIFRPTPTSFESSGSFMRPKAGFLSYDGLVSQPIHLIETLVHLAR